MDYNLAGNGPGGGGPGGRGKPGGGETVAGNNLSFPVIWAEGTDLTLREPPVGYDIDDVVTGGTWWYVWGVDPIDPAYPIYSCLPIVGADPCYLSATPIPPIDSVYKAWVQKDVRNFWQASDVNALEPVEVDVVDWGDNLESVDWYLTSKVRTEMGLYDNAPVEAPYRQYAMRHVSGWGTDELHGLQTTLEDEVVYGPGTQATVYTEHARLTIQKITSETPELTWNPETHLWTGDVLPPVVNKPVWEEGDGPTFFNAEVNIKGKIIFGYNWDVKRANDGVGVYRITFSFDETYPGGTALNTFFTESTILEGAEVIPTEDEGGPTAVIDVENNLTYIDITILGNKGGGKGGKGN
ncbi:hypothetical protein DDT91_05320 [Algoriphagus sp. AK58]|nr:hypothetical protein [Algoriphagus sp. AK58]